MAIKIDFCPPFLFSVLPRQTTDTELLLFLVGCPTLHLDSLWGLALANTPICEHKFHLPCPEDACPGSQAADHGQQIDDALARGEDGQAARTAARRALQDHRIAATMKLYRLKRFTAGFTHWQAYARRISTDRDLQQGISDVGGQRDAMHGTSLKSSLDDINTVYQSVDQMPDVF